MNCPCRRRGAEVVTKNIAITKIYIHVIFSNFTKILNHENLELYGIQLEGGSIGLTERRDNTDLRAEYFPILPDQK